MYPLTKVEVSTKKHHAFLGHSGIAGPWAWTLDSEMLDSGPIFPEISAQKHTGPK